MSKRESPKKTKGPSRIAPAGDGVEVILSNHTKERFLLRLHDIGITVDRLVAAVQHPNCKQADRADALWPERTKRLCRIESSKGFRNIMVVLVVQRPATASDPGAVELVTVIDKDAP